MTPGSYVWQMRLFLLETGKPKFLLANQKIIMLQALTHNSSNNEITYINKALSISFSLSLITSLPCSLALNFSLSLSLSISLSHSQSLYLTLILCLILLFSFSLYYSKPTMLYKISKAMINITYNNEEAEIVCVT